MTRAESIPKMLENGSTCTRCTVTHSLERTRLSNNSGELFSYVGRTIASVRLWWNDKCMPVGMSFSKPAGAQRVRPKLDSWAVLGRSPIMLIDGERPDDEQTNHQHRQPDRDH